MIGKDSINYSLRNLWHRKGRSFLTVFSILVGIATIFLFISFGLGLYQYTDSFTTGSSANKILIMAKGAGVPGLDDSIVLNDDDLRVVLRAAGVIDATGIYTDPVEVKVGSESKYVFMASMDPKKQDMLFELFQGEIIEGRPLQKGDNGVILGYNYKVPGKIFDRAVEVNDVVKINDNKLRVIGFMSEVGSATDDAQVYSTHDLFLDLFPDKESYAEIIATADLSDIDKAVENIERGLRNSRDLEKGKEDFYAQSFEDLIDSFSGALNIIVGFVILIALISVLVSAVNTANTMITSVLERYKEIGVLKSIGARNEEILQIFLFESAFLGFIAGILGVLLGWGLSSFAGNLLQQLGYGFLQPAFPLELFGGLILFAILTGAISGVFPAIRASKINTVDALRYE